MTACTSFLAFFAEQTLAFAEKMHSRPDRWPQIVRFASGRADSLANQRFVNDQRRRDKPPPLIVEKWDGPRFYAPFARLGSESSKKSKLAHTTLAPVGKSKR